MFDNKIDFSDIYKFLTSAGLVIMAVALIIPWLYIKQNNGIEISTQEFESFIRSSQILVQQKIIFSSVISIFIIPISMILFIMGIFSFSYGIIKWWNKQRDFVDKMDQISLDKRRVEYESLTSDEIENEASEDVSNELEVTTTTTMEPVTTDDTAIEEMKNELLSIEEEIYKKIKEYNPFDYIPKANIKIDNDQIDILLESYNIRKNSDIIIDINYLQSSLNMTFIYNRWQRFMKSIENYSKKNSKRKYRAVFIVVYKNDFKTDDKFSRFEISFNDFKKYRTASFSKIILLSDEDISKFDIRTIF